MWNSAQICTALWCVAVLWASQFCCPYFWKESLCSWDSPARASYIMLKVAAVRDSSQSFWRWIGAGRKRSFPSYIGGWCLVADLRKHTPECLVMATTIALYYSWWAFSIAPSWLIPESSKTKLRRKNLRWCRWFRYFFCIYYIYLYLLKLCAILPLAGCQGQSFPEQSAADHQQAWFRALDLDDRLSTCFSWLRCLRHQSSDSIIFDP